MEESRNNRRAPLHDDVCRSGDSRVSPALIHMHRTLSHHSFSQTGNTLADIRFLIPVVLRVWS
jgi:hypothetical protein